MNLNELFPNTAGRRPLRLLLLASTGGHLAQLSRIADDTSLDPHSAWMTFDSPQSRSLLAGKNVIYTDYVAPRDVAGVYKAFRKLRPLNPLAIDGVLSTGAALAVAGFAWARRHGVPAAYVESVSRTNGPSLTGKLVRMTDLAATYCQHSSWADTSWKLVPSVMQGYETERTETKDATEPLKILVTLGTIRPYRFDSLVDRIKQITIPGDTITWQLGETSRDDLPGEAHAMMDSESFKNVASRADVVVTHSGVGTILQLLEDGVSPVVVPRRRERNEHVDNHQMQIWQLLRDARLGVPREADSLHRADLIEAATSRTRTQTGVSE